MLSNFETQKKNSKQKQEVGLLSQAIYLRLKYHCSPNVGRFSATTNRVEYFVNPLTDFGRIFFLQQKATYLYFRFFVSFTFRFFGFTATI